MIRTTIIWAWWTALVVLLTLKLSGSSLSWWVVLSPILGPVAFMALLFIAALAVVLVARTNAKDANRAAQAADRAS